MATITVTTGTAGQAGSTAAELINELKRPMLAVAEFDDALEQSLFDPVESLQGAKTIQWNRMERLGVANTPAQLAEGVAAKPEPITVNSVTATMEEYGRAIFLSSLAQLTARSDLVQSAIRSLGYTIKETRDRLLYAIVNAATNTFRVNDRANDNATAVGDKLSFEEIAEIRGVLRTAGAPTKPDGTYHVVVHSSQYADLSTDSNWLASSQFAYADNIRRGIVDMILGVTIVETNSNSFTKTASATSGNSSAIRSAFIAGAGFAKVTDLEAAQIHTQSRGEGSDWMGRRYQLGWTMAFKGVISDQGFGRRIRASSSDATAVA